jgi:4-hydroxybenzoyl-CoA thioesterase
MSFGIDLTVRFAHVDAAGIVFYPRYFEMLNELVERWFAEDLGRSFAEIHNERKFGTPTTGLETRFLRPSRLGDVIRFELSVAKLTEKRALLDVGVSCADERRVEIKLEIAWVAFDPIRSEPWPDELRAAIARHLKSPSGTTP